MSRAIGKVPQFVALSVLAGSLVAIQGRMNGGLAERIGSPQLAALISFGSGLVLVSVIVFSNRSMREGVRRLPLMVRDGLLRKWQLFVGLAGALFVWAQASVVPQIGVAVFLVGVTAGVSIGSLAADRLGLSAFGVQQVSWRRVIAAAIAIGAVGLSVAGRGTSWSGVGLLALISFGVGALSAVQQAVNSQIGKVLAEPLSATWLNFVVGTAGLIALFGVSQLAAPGLDSGGGGFAVGDFWLLFGGVAGVGFIVASIVSIRRLGVLVFSLFLIVGQMATALFLDLWLPTSGSGVSAYLVLAVGLTLFAAVIALPRRTGP